MKVTNFWAQHCEYLTMTMQSKLYAEEEDGIPDILKTQRYWNSPFQKHLVMLTGAHQEGSVAYAFRDFRKIDFTQEQCFKGQWHNLWKTEMTFDFPQVTAQYFLGTEIGSEISWEHVFTWITDGGYCGFRALNLLHLIKDEVEPESVYDGRKVNELRQGLVTIIIETELRRMFETDLVELARHG